MTQALIVYPLIVAVMGFLMFGVIGSLLWGLFYELFYRFERRPLVRHALAAALAAVAAYLGFVFWPCWAVRVRGLGLSGL